MPYKVRARKCKQSDKTGGSHVVLKLKRGGGTKQVSCHTTKNLANRAVKARYASEIGESIMKITAGKLRQIIREEIERIQESPKSEDERHEHEFKDFSEYRDHPLIQDVIGAKGRPHGPAGRGNLPGDKGRSSRGLTSNFMKIFRHVPKERAKLAKIGRFVAQYVDGQKKGHDVEGFKTEVNKLWHEIYRNGMAELKRLAAIKRGDAPSEDPGAEVNLAFGTEED